MVVDPTINEQYIEMYADESARGGVLEPEGLSCHVVSSVYQLVFSSGVVEVSFKLRDLLDTMHRLDTVLIGFASILF